MRISYYAPVDNLDTNTGYGAAGLRVVTSLQALGHEVPFNDRTAPVQISFCPPTAYVFYPGQYKIGYTPWESTSMPGGWVDNMNKCDEVWATSEWCAKIYKDAGVNVPIKVYEHGVDKEWVPLDRTPSDKVRFLHFGEPALRKGGLMALEAFREAFGDSKDVELTFKTYEQHRLNVWTKKGFKEADKVYDNVNIISKRVSKKELLHIYGTNDVLVYPSYGEGFGLIPLQALATGMPTICTDDWAPYRRFLAPLELSGRYDRSVWPIHPGNIYYPNFDELVRLYQYSFENISSLRKKFYEQAPAVIAAYDWISNTENSFAHIVEKFTDK